MRVIISIGKPTHYLKGEGWSICGVQSRSITDNKASVNCLRCLKSLNKMNKKEEKQAVELLQRFINRLSTPDGFVYERENEDLVVEARNFISDLKEKK